jgi:hypothetical protein
MIEAFSAERIDSPQPAPEPCARCGSYGDLSSFWGKRLCAGCIERQPSLFRIPVSVRGLLAGVASLPARVWLLCAALHMAAGLPSALRTLAQAPPMQGIALDMLALSIAAAVATLLGVQAGLGENVSLKVAFSTLGRRVGPWFTTSFMAGLWVLALSLLFVVPGIVKALSFALTTPIVLLESLQSSGRVLKQSTERMRGARWSALVVYALFFCLQMFVIMAAAMVVGESTTPAALGAQATAELIGGGLASPTALVTVVLYLRLTPPGTVASAA